MRPMSPHPIRGPPTMFVTLKKDWLGNKAGATLDIPEPGDAELLIKGGVAEALQNDPLAPLLAKAVGDSLTKLNSAIEAAITKAVEQIGQAQALSRKGAAAR